MTKLILACVLITGMAYAQSPAKPYNLKDFATYFNNKWENDTAKSKGMGLGTRSYELILDGTHLQVNNKASNLSKDKKQMVCYHQDMGVFSFDKARKKITYREFTSEKFFSQYVCDSISADNKTFVFHSESFENVPPGYKGRITITILDDKTFIEHFELAEAGKEFQTYVKAYWIRK
jgi:hypothetical protein